MSRRALFKTTVAGIAGLGLTRPASVPARAATPLELSGDAVTTTVDFEVTGVDLQLDHRDARFKSGRIGLWTKADSITTFDDVVIRGMK